MEKPTKQLDKEERFDNRKFNEPRKINIEDIGNSTFKVSANNTTQFIFKNNKKINTLKRKNEPIENAILYLKNQPYTFKSFSKTEDNLIIRDFYEGEITENFGLLENEYKKSQKDKIERISYFDNKIYFRDLEKIGYIDFNKFF